MENYEIIQAINDYSVRLDELKSAANLKQKNIDLKKYNNLMENPDFWDDPKQSSNILKQMKFLKDIVESFAHLEGDLDDLKVFFDIYKTEDNSIINELENLIYKISTELNDFELQLLLSKEYDNTDAIIDMHPGAGGTESQDWCNMLYRMYRHYAEKQNYKIEVVDYHEGEEAGIKSVSFIISGENAYGHLKSEQGVHRLVRISPFDSTARRHTSFCAVTVVPSVENNFNIEIKPEDIRIDTYRSSGAGGQHVNTTDSAIRITHIKTGVVVTCQNERSQIQNRERALTILKSKLYQLEIEEQNKKMKNISGDIADNSFGSQIRSYVFHPYSMIKDHRTNYEVFDVNKVMDGDIDEFINAYLKSSYNVR